MSVHKYIKLTPVLLSCLLLATVAWASTPPATTPSVGDVGEAGVVEQLGGYLPRDLAFLNEAGDSVRIGDLVDRPVIVSLVYYSCPSVCRPLLTEVTDMLGKLQKMEMIPGEDYKVITISFDDTDSPEGSARLKKEYYDKLPDGFPASAWTWLTGDSVAVSRFTESVGFHFRRAGEDFAHPTTLVIVSPNGKITRYMYGAEYLPVDLKMALAEAKKEIASPTIARFLQFCFSYDPKGRGLVLNITRIVGLSTLLGIASVALFISASGKKRRKQKVG